MRKLFLILLSAFGLLLAASGGSQVRIPGPGGHGSGVLASWAYSHGAGGVASSPYTLSLGFTPAAGSMLLVGCQEFSTAALSISDNSSGPADSWTNVGPSLPYGYPSGYNAYRAAAWATVVTSGTAPTSVTCTGSGTIHMAVDNYSGNPGSIIQDGSAATAVGDSTSASQSYTTGSQAGDLVWAFVACDGNCSGGSQSPFTDRHGADSGGGTADDGVPSGILASTGVTATFNMSSQDWGIMVIGLKSH
jgi:hypothetical protein